LTSQMQTIFSVIPPTHPIQKILADYINKMTQLGDGSTFMVNLTCTLIKNIAILVQKGMKKVEISEALDDIKRNLLNYKFDTTEADLAVKSDSAKIFGGVLKEAVLIKIFTDSLMYISENNKDNFIKDLDDRIRIVKISTGTLDQSYAFQGMIFKGEPVTNKKECVGVSTSIFNCPVEVSKTITKGTVVFEKADELLSFSNDEQKEVKKLATKLTKNSNLIVCNGKVESAFIDELNDINSVAFSIYSKHDIRRIRNLFGGCISPLLREVKENGLCSKVSVFDDCNTKYTKFEGKGFVSTIVLKGSIKFMLDEYERILQKAITLVMKNKTKMFTLVEGSGKFENSLVMRLSEESEISEGNAKLVYKALVDSLNEVAVKEKGNEIYDILDIKLKAVKYAIEICSIVLTTEDYFFVRTNDNLGIQARGPGPRDN